MAKYTQDQIYQAFLDWETDRRLYPETFASQDEIREMNVDTFAAQSTMYFTQLMDSQNAEDTPNKPSPTGSTEPAAESSQST